MSDYIRRRTPGATYFFTIRLADRSGDLLIRAIADLRRAMRDTIDRHAFRIDAIAVLPAAIHTIWTLPEGDSDYPNRIGMLKSRFSRAMPMPTHRTLTQIQRGEKGIWQRRYWEHQIRDAADLARHRDLIHLSPVHAGLCPRPQDWPHSSLHRDIAQGKPPPAPIGHGGAAGLHLTHPRLPDQAHHIS
jgi:putative transposase